MLLLDQLGDEAQRIAASAATGARHGNSSRLLEQLMLGALPNGDSTQSLRGDERSLELSTRCDVPAGWREPCRVAVGIDQQSDSSVIVGTLPHDEFVPLATVRGLAKFRYRSVARNDSTWVARWTSLRMLPPAIAIVTARDTLVLAVSAR